MAEFDLKKVTTNDWILAGGCIAVFFGVFFPWFSVGGLRPWISIALSGDVNGFHYFFQGTIPWIIAIAVLVLLVLRKFFAGEVKMPDRAGSLTWSQVYLIASAVAAVLVLLRLLMGDSGLDEGLEASMPSASSACSSPRSAWSPWSSVPTSSSRRRKTTRPEPGRARRLPRRSDRRSSRLEGPCPSPPSFTSAATTASSSTASVPHRCRPLPRRLHRGHLNRNPSGLDRLGPRVDRRPEPRLGTALAGAGIALVVLGALTIGGDNVGGTGEDGTQVPGILLSLAIVAGGYALSVRHRSGALGAAAVAASVLALPALIGFATFDRDQVPQLPFDTILVVCTVVWLLSYVFSPARGHNLYLGAGLLALWLWLLEVTEGLLSYPSLASESLDFLSTDAFPFDDSGTPPDVDTIASITLVLSVASLVAGALLDQRRRHGIATPFVFLGVIQLAIGVALYSDDLQQTGEGVAAVVLGLAVVWMGSIAGRRLTTWIGAASVWLGLVLLIDQVLGDGETAIGIGAIVAGVALVALAHVLSVAWREPERDGAGPFAIRLQGRVDAAFGPATSAGGLCPRVGGDEAAARIVGGDVAHDATRRSPRPRDAGTPDPRAVALLLGC